MENNKSTLFSLLVADCFGCLHCFPNRCRSHFSILNFPKFSVSKQNCQCWCAFFGNKNIIIIICHFFFYFFIFFYFIYLFFFVAAALEMLSTERRRYGVNVLLGNVSCPLYTIKTLQCAICYLLHTFSADNVIISCVGSCW